MNPLLIAGIDPGTTTAYALLDIDGNVVLLESGRNLGREAVVRKISEHGTPFVIGCDKRKTPGLVTQVAASFGARVVSPDEDMLAADKHVMTRDFSNANAHESDALAGALLALHFEAPRIARVRQKLKAQNQSALEQQVLPLVLRFGMSITAAIALVTTPEEAVVSPVMAVVKDDQVVDQKSVIMMYNELVRLRKANRFLKSELDRVRTRIGAAEKARAVAQERLSFLPEQKAGRLLWQKEERIRLLEKEVGAVRMEATEQRKRLERVTSCLAIMGDVCGVRYVRDLGGKENIPAGALIFVDDPYNWSERTVRELCERNCVVLTDGQRRPPRIEGIVFLDARSLNRIVVGRWVFFKRKELDALLASRTALKKIVEDYQRQRT